jgi:uncharacterized SAM-binding protein YcdF (DUF218 family)
MSRSFKIVIAALILMLAWFFLAWFLADRLIVEKPLAKADAIMVLSGSAAYIERTQRAAQAYKDGVAPKIFLTDDGEYAGWSKIEQRNPPYVHLAKQSLISQGVPADAIEVLQPQVTGTHYEADLLQRKAAAENLSSVLLVTSPYHSRRALWVVNRELKNANTKTQVGIVSPSPGQQTPPPHYWWLSARGWYLVAGEYVKSAYYLIIP